MYVLSLRMIDDRRTDRPYTTVDQKKLEGHVPITLSCPLKFARQTGPEHRNKNVLVLVEHSHGCIQMLKGI